MKYIKKLYDDNFLEYASYVIKERAIPDINDGLKPVQRRILHSLFKIDDGKFNKVANVIGHTMQYHPHGDASIGDALVNLAQKDFFIDKQGNFGNIYTGDPASASRYIECRLTNLAKETLFNPKITEYSDSYDGRNKEPIVLPAKLPVLLLQGTEGIAVGMSTKILPHNFCEVLEAQIKYLNKEDFILYPDFQQGGVIDISEYKDGNGKIKVNAVIEYSKKSNRIIIKEIPYGTTTESLINSIENAVKNNKFKISSISDFTAEKVEIEIKPARGISVDDTVKALYAFTNCQISISVNAIVIKNNMPINMTVSEILKYNTDRLIILLKQELNLKLDELNDKLHNLTLERIFIENRIYKSIEECKTYENVIKSVETGMNKFKKLFIRDLTIEDIERLLKIQIRRISRYDINKANKDIDDIVRNIKKTKSNLRSIKKFTIKFIQEILNKYKDFFPRKTKFGEVQEVDKTEAALANTKLFYNKETGYIGTQVKSENFLTVSNYDKILVMNKKGVYKVIGVSEKEFVDKDVIFYNIFNPEIVFTVVYKNLTKKQSFVKKFKIEKFINNKEYNFIKIPGRLQFFSTKLIEKIQVNYLKKPRLKKLIEEFDLNELAIKSVSAAGNRLSNKEVSSVKKI